VNRSRRYLSVVVMYTGLLVLLAVCGLRLHRSRVTADAAVGNLESCMRLASQIGVLRAAPMHASLQRQSSQDLALQIDRAAQIAQIAGSAIVRINPQASRRVEDSAILEQPTCVEIRQISLEQLVKFLGELSSSESGLQATSIRLTAPRASAGDQQCETWSVEVVLTHLIFSPEYATRPS